MEAKLIRADIVIIASAHNPSIMAPQWLKDESLILEEPSHFVHTPDLAIFESEYFSLIVDHNRLQIAVKKQDTLSLESLSTHPTLDLRKLEQHYTLRNRSEVIEFAMNNSFLLQPLHEAYDQIRNYFGESTQAVLEVVADPEFFEDQELVIFIRTDLSPDDALKKLEQIDNEWWLDVPADVRKKLCVTVEFI